jgi:hypothetical protein
MDIGAWLRDLGLGRYERAFQEGEIASMTSGARPLSIL